MDHVAGFADDLLFPTCHKAEAHLPPEVQTASADAAFTATFALSALPIGWSAFVPLPTGDHALYGQVDTYDGFSGSPDYGMIRESNEDNNITGPVTVTVR